MTTRSAPGTPVTGRITKDVDEKPPPVSEKTEPQKAEEVPLEAGSEDVISATGEILNRGAVATEGAEATEKASEEVTDASAEKVEVGPSTMGYSRWVCLIEFVGHWFSLIMVVKSGYIVFLKLRNFIC